MGTVKNSKIIFKKKFKMMKSEEEIKDIVEKVIEKELSFGNRKKRILSDGEYVNSLVLPWWYDLSRLQRRQYIDTFIGEHFKEEDLDVENIVTIYLQEHD